MRSDINEIFKKLNSAKKSSQIIMIYDSIIKVQESNLSTSSCIEFNFIYIFEKYEFLKNTFMHLSSNPKYHEKLMNGYESSSQYVHSPSSCVIFCLAIVCALKFPFISLKFVLSLQKSEEIIIRTGNVEVENKKAFIMEQEYVYEYIKCDVASTNCIFSMMKRIRRRWRYFLKKPEAQLCEQVQTAGDFIRASHFRD